MMTAVAPRIKIRNQYGIWTVTCDTCSDINWLALFAPWAKAVNHATAITLAQWHIDEHRARTCDHCGRTDALPTPQAVDSSHMSFEGRLYEIRNTGVVAIGTAA